MLATVFGKNENLEYSTFAKGKLRFEALHIFNFAFGKGKSVVREI